MNDTDELDNLDHVNQKKNQKNSKGGGGQLSSDDEMILTNMIHEIQSKS